MPRGTHSSRRHARTLLRAAGLALALGVGGGCSSSSSPSTCNDISGSICEKLQGCGALTTTFDSTEQCVASFNGYFEVGNADDTACRAEWAVSEPLDCAAFIAHYSI